MESNFNVRHVTIFHDPPQRHLRITPLTISSAFLHNQFDSKIYPSLVNDHPLIFSNFNSNIIINLNTLLIDLKIDLHPKKQVP